MRGSMLLPPPVSRSCRRASVLPFTKDAPSNAANGVLHCNLQPAISARRPSHAFLDDHQEGISLAAA